MMTCPIPIESPLQATKITIDQQQQTKALA